MSIGEYEIKDFIEEHLFNWDEADTMTVKAFDRLIIENESVKEDIFRIWTLESNHDYDDDDLIDGTSTLEGLISDFIQNQVLGYDGYSEDFETCVSNELNEMLDISTTLNTNHSYILGELLSLFQSSIEEDKAFLVGEFCDESYLTDYLKSIIENNTLDFNTHEPCERCQRLSIKSCKCGR